MWGQGVGLQGAGEGEGAGWWKEGEEEGEVEQTVDLYVHVGMQELLMLLLYRCMYAFTRGVCGVIYTVPTSIVLLLNLKLHLIKVILCSNGMTNVVR